MRAELQAEFTLSQQSTDRPRPDPKDARASPKIRARHRMHAVEEIFALDHPDEPPTMQFELRVSGSLDEERLAEAVAAAVAIHPMTQARQVARRFLLRPPLWEVGTIDMEGVVRATDCADDEAMTAIRDEFYSTPIPLRKPPALLALLVRRPGGDSLLFSIHHSIMDGMGALRWMNSVARAYTGRPDPVPPIDPFEIMVRRVKELRAQFNGGDSARPAHPCGSSWTRSVSQVAPMKPTGDRGYGIRLAVVSEEHCGSLNSCRYAPDATLNDLLVAALHLTIASWNRDLGYAIEYSSILVPSNLRPPEWSSEVVANLAIANRSLASPEDRRTPGSLMAAVTAQAQQIRAGMSKYIGRATWECWLIDNVILPLILYHPGVVPRRVKGPVDTILFANLGRIERRVSDFGPEAGRLTEFWVSPPVGMPMGLGLDAAILRGRLHLALRYRRVIFDGRSAEDFLALFVRTLMRLGRGEDAEPDAGRQGRVPKRTFPAAFTAVSRSRPSDRQRSGPGPGIDRVSS